MTEMELMRAQIHAMEANTRAMEAYTAALREHTAALYEQAEAQKKLERTMHNIFEDRNGTVLCAADSKLRGLMQLADKFNESSHRAENAANCMLEASKRMANRY